MSQLQAAFSVEHMNRKEENIRNKEIFNFYNSTSPSPKLLQKYMVMENNNL